MVAAEVAAAVTLDTLLEPERLNRLPQQDRLHDGMLGPEELPDGLLAAVLPSDASGAGEAAVQRRVATQTILEIPRLQRDPTLSPPPALQLDTCLPGTAARPSTTRTRARGPPHGDT